MFKPTLAVAMLAPLLAAALPAPDARAGEARVITRPVIDSGETLLPPRYVGQPRYSIPLEGPRRYTFQVINPPIARPAAVVTRDLAEQPVYEHLVELRINNTTVLIDPEQDYIHKPWGGMDENLSIAQAARIARSITARRATIVRSSAIQSSRPAAAGPAARSDATTRSVIFGPTQPFPQPRPQVGPLRPIPRVPAAHPERKTPPPMA